VPSDAKELLSLLREASNDLRTFASESTPQSFRRVLFVLSCLEDFREGIGRLEFLEGEEAVEAEELVQDVLDAILDIALSPTCPSSCMEECLKSILHSLALAAVPRTEMVWSQAGLDRMARLLLSRCESFHLKDDYDVEIACMSRAIDSVLRQVFCSSTVSGVPGSSPSSVVMHFLSLQQVSGPFPAFCSLASVLQASLQGKACPATRLQGYKALSLATALAWPHIGQVPITVLQQRSRGKDGEREEVEGLRLALHQLCWAVPILQPALRHMMIEESSYPLMQDLQSSDELTRTIGIWEAGKLIVRFLDEQERGTDGPAEVRLYVPETLLLLLASIFVDGDLDGGSLGGSALVCSLDRITAHKTAAQRTFIQNAIVRLVKSWLEEDSSALTVLRHFRAGDLPIGGSPCRHLDFETELVEGMSDRIAHIRLLAGMLHTDGDSSERSVCDAVVSALESGLNGWNDSHGQSHDLHTDLASTASWILG
jgi:hypothetical protein